MRVQRDGRDFKVVVTADGEGLVGHAGASLLAEVADKTGLTGALSLGLAGMKERRSGHDPGLVVRDLAAPGFWMVCAPRTPRHALARGSWA